MSYYEEVYLKRINQDGHNIQERAKTRRENEFNKLFLQRTKYRTTIYEINEEQSEIISSLQPTKWNQDKLVSNLLVSTDCGEKFKVGDVIKSFQKIKEEELDKTWIVMHKNDNITHGYQEFELIELSDTIVFKNEYGDTLNIISARFVSETSVYVQDKFSSYGAVTYREPLAHRKFITRDYSFLKKGLYFDYNGRGWEIDGIDNISIEGVAYVSVKERLLREPEPKTSEDIIVGENDNFWLIGR